MPVSLFFADTDAARKRATVIVPLGVLSALAMASAGLMSTSAHAASAADARDTKQAHHGGSAECAGKDSAKHKDCKKANGGTKNALVSLRDSVTGFSVRAPRDFTVSHTSKGVEHVASRTRRAFVNYLLLDSPEAPAKVAQTLIAQSKSTIRSSSQTASSFTAAILTGGQAETLEVRQVASGRLAITAWGTIKAKPTSRHSTKKGHGKGRGKHSKGSTRHARKASAARASAPEQLEPLLKQIAEGAHGGRGVTAPVEKVKKPVAAISLQPFTNSDHSATAEVPTGFNCAGSKGIIECLDPAHGGIEFGVGMPVCVSGSTKAYYAEHVPGEAALCAAISPFLEDSTTAATAVWGPTLDKLIGAGIANVTLASSQPAAFGAGWHASFDILRFTRNGVPWEAAMIAATTAATGSPEEWLFYYSDVSAPQSGNSAYGQALAKSWASFNPSAAEQQRLTESENDQKATTAVIEEADAFRQEISEEASENWDAIIREAGTGRNRGGEEVENAKEEIDEKTREAVGRAKEEIEEQLP